MKKPLSLPVAVRVAAPAPTVDAARAKLGGRAQSGPLAGTVVADGVVVFADDAEAWVWVGEGRLRRTTPAALVKHDGAAPRELERVAADVRVFAALREGERVRWVGDDAAMQEGTLAEKCRFGALVATAAGTVVAVAFRRLWPLAASSG